MKTKKNKLLQLAYKIASKNRDQLRKIANQVARDIRNLPDEDALLVQLAVRELFSTEIAFLIIADNQISRLENKRGKAVKCADIPDRPVLELLARNPETWHNWFDPNQHENSVLRAMPEGTPGKMALAKMRQLMKRGLVGGCACGCRGDFVITGKGFEALKG